MTSQQITALENIYQSLHSYSLPDELKCDANDPNNINSTSSINKSIINEFRNTRETYLRDRIQRRFIEYMSTYDGTSFNLPPDVISSDTSDVKLEIESEEIINDIQRSSSILTEKRQLLISTAAVIEERRDELGKVLKDAKIKAEKQKMDDGDDASVMDDTNDDDDREFMTIQHNEALTNLTHHRIELEAKLKRIENDMQRKKSENLEKKQRFKEMINTERPEFNDDLLKSILDENQENGSISSPRSLEEYEKSFEMTRDKSIELELKAEHNNTMATFYGQMKAFTMKSSGVELLHIDEPKLHEDESNPSNAATTPSKKKKHNVS